MCVCVRVYWRIWCRVNVCERVVENGNFFGYLVQSCLLLNGWQCTYRSDNSVWNEHIHRPIIHTCIYQGNACKDKVLLRSFHYNISVVCVLHAFQWLRTNLHGFHISVDIHQTASIDSHSDWLFANSFLLSNSIYRNRTISTSFDGVFLSYRYHISCELLFSIQCCNFCPSYLSLSITLYLDQRCCCARLGSRCLFNEDF